MYAKCYKCGLSARDFEIIRILFGFRLSPYSRKKKFQFVQDEKKSIIIKKGKLMPISYCRKCFGNTATVREYISNTKILHLENFSDNQKFVIAKLVMTNRYKIDGFSLRFANDLLYFGDLVATVP